MEKVAISVLGCDRPGIVAAVSRGLFENRCNIEDVSQTTLQMEFAAVFIASLPDGLTEEALLANLRLRLAPMELSVHVKPLKPGLGVGSAPESEPFVITTNGIDRPGLVAGITEVMARYGVNITNLKAAFRGGPDPVRIIMIYEVDVPVGAVQSAFRAALHERARELDLDISLQHRAIFEAMHRV